MTENGQTLDNAVFADTSALFAIANERDDFHGSAIAILDRLSEAHRPLVTTNIIATEFHALVMSRMGHAVARGVLANLYNGEIRIIRASAADEERARVIIAQSTDRAFSYADAISFAVMDRLHIHVAFTFDRHFAQYGVPTLGQST